MNLKICVDIGTKFIKIIEGYERNEKIYISKILKIENPIKNFRNLSEEDVEKIGAFLKNYLLKNNIVGKLGIFSISGEDVIYHYFELPSLPKAEFENAIKFEGAQIIPEFEENYEYDFISFNSENKKNVLLIAYPSKKIELYTKILNKAGIRPIIIDIDGSAIINSFLSFGKKEEILIPILNIGYSFSNLAIYLKDKFLFIRDIPWGIKNIPETEKETEIKPFLDDIIGEFLEDINVSIKYFNNKTNKKIEKIYLTGGGSDLPEIRENIEKRLGLICEYYNPLLYFKENIPSEIKNEGKFFAVATGLLTRRIT